MPELSRFFGIVIRMFSELGAPHSRPHIHVYYHESSAVYAIDDSEVLAGHLAAKQHRLVVAWMEHHRNELSRCWERLQAGRPPFKIEPLR